jgi:hypothetical protein
MDETVSRLGRRNRLVAAIDSLLEQEADPEKRRMLDAFQRLSSQDTEKAHELADELMAMSLEKAGWDSVARAFRYAKDHLDFWYA